MYNFSSQNLILVVIESENLETYIIIF